MIDEMVARYQAGHDLYRATGGKDIAIRIHHSLCEPTCPTVCVVDDDKDYPDGIMARFDADTIQEAVEMALDWLCATYPAPPAVA